MDKVKKGYTATVPLVVVKNLKSKEGGINPIIDDLRKNHMLDVNYNGKSLTLIGFDDDILDMANELLHIKADIKVFKGIRTLGGEGSVIWTFKGPMNIKIRGLFDLELQEILKIDTVKQLTDSNNDTFTISCKYTVYKTMKQKMEDLERKAEKCTCMKMSVNKAEFQKAKWFVQSRKYCCQLVEDKIGKTKHELQFYGKDDQSCKKAVESWDIFKNSSEQKEPSGKEKESQKGNKGNITTEIAKPVSETVSPAVMESTWEDQTPTDNPKGDVTDMTEPQMEISTQINVDSCELHQKTENQTMKLSSSSTASVGQTGNFQADVSSTKIKMADGTVTGSGEKAKYSCIIGEMHVYVYKESITDIKGMDAITNAANEKLMHGGGVAFYISKAAGKKMDQDCRTYIDKIGKLPVTQNYVSIPGDMKCKGIIHAVGPIWWDYKDRQDECARDLYETVKNVLKEVRSRGWRKVALSAISSGLFGVPKKLCAEMYMKAFSDFAAEGPRTLKEVHFIDVSRQILDLVIDAHKDLVKAPGSLSFQNAFRYPSTTTGNEKTKNRLDKRSDAADKTSPVSVIRFEGEGTTSYGERIFKYSIGDKMKLFVYNGSLTRLDIEAIGIPTGTTGSHLMLGPLAMSVERLAGKTCTSSLLKSVKEKKRQVIVSKETGSLKCQNIVHVVAPVVTDMSTKSLQVISSIYRLALTHDYSGKIKKLAMPLTGTGICFEKSDLPRLCQCVVTTVAEVCADTVQPQIKEFHIVNNDPSSTMNIQNELRVCTSSSYNKNNSVGVSVRQASKKNASGHVRQEVDMDGWIRHKPLPEVVINEEKKNVSANEKVSKFFKDAPKNGRCVYCPEKAATKMLHCGHVFCKACFIPMQSNGICTNCTSIRVDVKDSVSAPTEYPICLETITKPKELPCKHKLCLTCFEVLQKKKPECPTCLHKFGIIRGNQPPGEMFYRFMKWDSLPGYDQCGVVQIYYDIPDGKQTDDHPNPGAPFKGTQRYAFLPDNENGREVLKLLRRAFDRKLIFTVGESRTTGKEGVVTWNDIHHKTKTHGGAERFGYPDSTYLVRVKEELVAKGVTA